MGDPEHLKLYAVEQSEDSFAALVQKYGGMVISAATRITGDRELAEEISQNVFAIMARKARTLTKYHSLSGWLHRTTLLEARNFLRQQRRRQRKMKALSDHESIGADQRGLPDETLEHLDQAIDRLRESDRRVILLKFFDGLSNREIGAITGKTEAASQRQVHRVLQKLSGILERRGAIVSTGALATFLASEISEACTKHVATNLSMAALAGVPSITQTNLIANTVLMMIRKPSLWALVAGTATAIAVILPLTSNSNPQEKSTKPRSVPPTSASATESQATSATIPSSEQPPTSPASLKSERLPSLSQNIKVHVTSSLVEGAPIDVVFSGCGRQMLGDMGLGKKRLYEQDIPIIGGVHIILIEANEDFKVFADISARIPIDKGGGRVGFESTGVQGEIMCKLGTATKLLDKEGSHVASITVDKLSATTGGQAEPDQDIEIRFSGTTSGGVAIGTTVSGWGPGSVEEDLGSRIIGDKDISIKSAIDYKVTRSANGYELQYAFGFRQPVPSGMNFDFDDYLVEGAVLCSPGETVEIYRSGGQTLSINLEVAQ